jgi:hypothetical protein
MYENVRNTFKNKIGKIYSAEYIKVPNVFFSPYPMGVI